jgi:hypothetical protein
MFGANRAPILHWHYHYLQMDWNKIPHNQCHIGDPSGASKTISEPMVRSTQTMHQSRIKISTISKQTKTSIHSSLVTYVYHRGCRKRFLCLWYVWRKQCTYLALTVPLYPNGLKRDSTWLMSPMRSIGCIQNDFWANGTFDANCSPILRQG